MSPVRFVYDGVDTMVSSDPHIADIRLGDAPPAPPPEPEPGAERPGPVQSAAATAGAAMATITWVPGASDGGAPITAYRIGRVGSTETRDASPGATSMEWGSLAAAPVSFTVRPVNAVGVSLTAVTTNTVTPAGLATTPGPPASLTPTAIVGGARIAWTLPTDNGGSPITGWVIGVAGSTAQQTYMDPALRSVTVQPLIAGVDVRLTVAAINALGTGTTATSTPVRPLAPAGPTPPDEWWGWDPESPTRGDPPRRPLELLPFHDNTGLWHPDHRNPTTLALGSMFSTVNGNFTTSSNGQVVRFLRITGNVAVNHDDVVFEFCLIEGRRTGRRKAKYRYCDIGCSDGRAGDFTRNSTDGGHRPDDYACNLYGYTDFYKPDGGGVNILARDCFMHDARLAWDSWNSNYSHPDAFHITGTFTGTARAEHCTLFAWGINNFTSTAGPGPAKESCTRKSGPHWTDVDGDPINVTGSTASAGLNGGRTNALVIIFAGTVELVDTYLNGACYSYVNGPSRATRAVASGNRINPSTIDSGRHPLGGRTGWDVYSGNVHYRTGATIA